MRTSTTTFLILFLLAGAGTAAAQQTPPPPAVPDTAAAADSAAAAAMLAGQPASAPEPEAAAQSSGGPTNPRLMPDVSVVGDLVGDLSPKGSTQPDRTRFGVREVELAVQAAVDPYFRGDVFLGFSDAEKVSIEQAYLTTTGLPYGLEARLGRYLMPFGKQNLTHRHDLHTTEYPWVIQRFLGQEGIKGTGLWVSKVLAPFGFYQEIQVTAVDRLGEAPEGLVIEEPVNKRVGGMGYSARLRNYFDVSQASNFEVSGSVLTGRVERPATLGPQSAFDAVSARRTTVGADVTYRWRPLQQGLYKSVIVQGEFMRQMNQHVAALTEPARSYDGAYLFGRYQLAARTFLGARYDWLQDPENGGRTLNAGSGYLEFYPSEFSKLSAALERFSPGGQTAVNRLLMQATFSLGPHKPHPF